MKKNTPITHFVINYICVEDLIKDGNLIKDGRIIVGVTDNVRWKNAIDMGDSGVSELTWMSALLTENGTKEQRFVPTQSIDFFSYHPSAPIHALMHQYITELLNIVHQIRDEELTQAQARKCYLGYKITKKSSDYNTEVYF